MYLTFLVVNFAYIPGKVNKCFGHIIMKKK